MKTVLITGASGYLGKSFISSYSKKYKFVAFSLRNDKIENINFSTIDVIVHCAALVHQVEEKGYKEYQKINVLYTLDLAAKAKQNGVKHFVFISSIAIYGNNYSYINSNSIPIPETNYGRSKLEAEKKLKNIENNNFIVSIIRPPMIYGKNAPGNISKIIKLTTKLRVLPLGGIKNKRTFVFIENLMFYLNKIIERAERGVFLVSDDESISTSELIDIISKKKNINFKLPFLGLILMAIKPNMYTKLYGNLVIDNSDTLIKFDCKTPFSTKQGLASILK